MFCFASCTLAAMYEVGGYEGMVNQYMVSASDQTMYQQSLYGNASCGFVPDDALKIFRGIDSDYPWPGLVFGLTLLATYFFCTNQVPASLELTMTSRLHVKLKFGSC